MNLLAPVFKAEAVWV